MKSLGDSIISLSDTIPQDIKQMINVENMAKKVIATSIGDLRIFCNTIASNIVARGNTKNTNNNKFIIIFSFYVYLYYIIRLATILLLISPLHL